MPDSPQGKCFGARSGCRYVAAYDEGQRTRIGYIRRAGPLVLLIAAQAYNLSGSCTTARVKRALSVTGGMCNTLCNSPGA